MDWTLAIERNREALRRVVGVLVSLAGLGEGRATLPRHLHRALLALVRPAEAAVRRLVIIAARGLPLPTPLVRAARRRRRRRAGIADPADGAGQSPATPARPGLPLLDPPRRLHHRASSRSGVPRISVPGVTRVFAVAPRVAPRPDDAIDAARLVLRLSALSRALDDLPREARRFARWLGARNAAVAAIRDGGRRGPRHPRIWPLRLGRPPGHRARRRHEVHDLLDETHGLAFMVLEAPDTS